mmetsp:Transcript_39885/g.118284  ORF Transcript_39885/g.118284 Transcript_39885/m.118284 type:complete len:290 (+) Transcript_39885:293-1162(+)
MDEVRGRLRGILCGRAPAADRGAPAALLRERRHGLEPSGLHHRRVQRMGHLEQPHGAERGADELPAHGARAEARPRPPDAAHGPRLHGPARHDRRHPRLRARALLVRRPSPLHAPDIRAAVRPVRGRLLEGQLRQHGGVPPRGAPGDLRLRGGGHAVALHGDHRWQRLGLLLPHPERGWCRARPLHDLLHDLLLLRRLQRDHGHLRGQGPEGRRARQRPAACGHAPQGEGVHPRLRSSALRVRPQQQWSDGARGVPEPHRIRRWEILPEDAGHRAQPHRGGVRRASQDP